MLPPSYSVQLCLPSTGKRGSGPKGGSVPKRGDATVARDIASLQLDLLPLLAGIIMFGRGREGAVCWVFSMSLKHWCCWLCLGETGLKDPEHEIP